MTQQTSSSLDRIVADVRHDLDARKQEVPLAQLKASLAAAPPTKPFAQALRGRAIRLIAEVKKASPSRGLLAPDLDPVVLARAYAAGGAAAISVLTEERYFLGGLQHLSSIRAALAGADRPPLLRKDFLFDVYQLYEARANGADGVLLIAAVLEPGFLAELIEQARDLGLGALVEVHDERELGQALTAKADVVGINNRNLRTFQVDLSTSERLRPLIPAGVTVVGESGIHSREEVLRLQSLGVHAVLIGEAFVTAPDPAAKMRELFP